MIYKKNILQRIKYIVPTLLLLASLLPVLFTQSVVAQQLTNRSLMVTSTNASDDMLAPDGTTYTSLDPGDPRNGAQVGHTYTFTITSDADAKAITIQYCDSPFGYMAACVAPAGFSDAAWNSASVNVTVDSTTESWGVTTVGANFLTISNGSSAIDFESGDVAVIDFDATLSDYFANPNKDYLNNTNDVSSPQQATYFAHIRTHNTATPTTTNYTTLQASTIDDGTVTSSVAQSISIYTRVQETLNFSVEGDQDGPGGAPNGPSSAYAGSGPCTALTAPGQLKMGDPNHALSTQSTSKAKSYFRLSTNSAFGTTVFYTGETLQSPNHDLAAIGIGQTPSVTGQEQFGIAFDLTDGANNVGNGSQLTPEPVYNNNANGYAFNATSPNTPKPLASITNGGVSCDTGAVEYIANISPDTPAGIYQTKINYIVAPKY